jgi:ornithine cyclodeaminase
MGDPGHDMHGHVTTFPGNLSNAEGLESGPDRRFSAMPAYVGGDIHKMGIKWYGSNITNPAERGLPRSIHTITLNDPLSGKPEFLIDGQVASSMRTGAVAGVGAARIQGDRASTATVIGPGVIGQTSALALDAALDSLETLRIHHPEEWKAEAFAEEMADDIDAEIEPVGEARAAVNGSDVTVVAATGSPPPKIEGSWLKDDCLVIPLGNTLEFAAHMDWQIMNALGAAVDYGIGLDVAESDLRALHEVIGGEDTASTEGRSILYSPGLPMEDVAWATRVYENAVERDLRQTLTMFEESYFSKPY